MSKLNHIEIEARIITDVRSKSFGSKTVHEFCIQLSAGKDKDGNWKNALQVVKYWGDNCKSKGQDVIIKGRLAAETWEKDGKQMSKSVIVADSIDAIGGNDGNPDLPF